LNSAVSSLKKPELIPSPIPKKEIRAKLNMHACPPLPSKAKAGGELRWDEGRARLWRAGGVH